MELGILGPLEARDGDRAVALGGVRQRALLATLLVHAGQVLSTDRLIDALWGDEPPATAAHTIQVYVSNLRKALGADGSRLIVTRAPGYVAEPAPDELDASRFDRLVRDGQEALEAGDAAGASRALGVALSLWRGQPLADFAYEAFAQAPIARLEEQRLAATEARIDADLALGRHATLVAELQELVGEHPLRERLRCQLMLALYRAGRQADALEAFQAARRALVEELGIDPGPVLQGLERAILNQDPALDVAAVPAPVGGAVPGASAAPERAIIVAGLAEGDVPGLLPVASPLGRSHVPHELLVMHVVDPGTGPGALTAAVHAVNTARAELAADGVPARAAAFTSAEPGRDLARLATDQDVDLLLAPLASATLPDWLATVLIEAPCDVAALTVARDLGDGPVLVPFAGGVHDWAALELGTWLASAGNRGLRLIGAGEGLSGGRDASRLLAHAALAAQQLAAIATEPLLTLAGPTGVVEAAREASVVVLGLGESWEEEGIDRARAEIVTSASVPVAVVRRGVRPGGLTPRASLTRYTWS